MVVNDRYLYNDFHFFSHRTDVIIVANVFIPSSANASSGVLLGARLGRGGCNMQSADGVYAILDATAGTFELVVQVGKWILSLL